jgi:O-antigen ligase
MSDMWLYIKPAHKNLFLGFSAILATSLWASVVLEQPLLAGIPLVLLFGYSTILDIRRSYFLLLFCIPLSVEYYFDNGFATDLPTEPLMVGLMGVYWLYVLRRGGILEKGIFLIHPMTLLVLLHLAWLFVCVINSSVTFISAKFFAAKVWYIVTFYFLTRLMLREERDMRLFIRVVAVPLTFAVLSTLIRHGMEGFSFEEVNYVMQPLFRNHVNFSAIISIFIPFVLLGFVWSKGKGFQRWLFGISLLILILGVQFSYTRAAYGALLGAGLYYFVLKYRLTKYVVLAITIGLIFFIGYITSHNKYLDYAPNYERAVTHKNFDNLLEATAKGEDVSTMERVHRWVAGFHMVGKKPVFGFGPGSFYTYYKSFTVNRFRTYVSENTEQSTVHCYFLLLAIEQGIFGSMIFFALVFYSLFKAESLFHALRDKWQRQLVVATVASLVVIYLFLIINDLVEADKTGTFFFMNLAILVNLDLRQRQSRPTETEPQI